jgi:sn-glycerol 3-phosphate transport system ATP-binding protein
MATVNLMAVSKFYDNHRILHDINLNIEKGEFVAVVGPSGCGKSTLLRLVAGLDSVTHGTILINNKCVNKTPAASRDMAMVFQNYALYPHMTAYDNIAYGLKMRGMKKAEIHQRVERVGELLQLGDYLHRKPLLLSGGQRQRVAMGRAIVRSPAVFLFDEPLSNLDAKLRTEMRHEIRKLHQQLNTTCLYVTHDQTEAMTMASRVVVLNKGNVEQVGTPQELYQNPASLFVASFIGHYPMNFLPGKIDLKQRVILTSTGNILPLPTLKRQLACGEPVIVGIRPEHMQIIAVPEPGSLGGSIEFVDDLGADKLVQVITDHGQVHLSVRAPGDTQLGSCSLVVKMDVSKANLFCEKNGTRLGGWSDK